MKKFILLSLFSSFLFLGVQAQNVTVPTASKKASVSEWIGMTEVTINYHRPGVKGREIWGALVPYNEGNPIPWRAGANDNTTVHFQHDVKINGKDLAAGTYGIHVIPSESEWTFIFSHTNTDWGSFNYTPANDALRVAADVQDCEHVEWLKYEFTDQTDNSLMVQLSWEKKMSGFKVETDVHGIALQSIRNELGHLNGFSWQGWNSAAQYCLQNDVNLEEGLAWANRSITGGFGAQANFTNLQTKSQILDKLGRSDESKEVMGKAIPLATMTELHFYGRSLVQAGKNAEAMKIFQLNRDNNPDDNFTTLVGLARGHMALGNNEEAIKYFEMAAPNAPTGQTQFYLDLAKGLKEKG